MKTRAALISIFAVALSAVAGCGGSSNKAQAPSPEAKPATQPTKPAAQPKTEDGAKSAAQNEFDAYAAGDWGGAWDLWTQEGKAAFSRADYIALHTECKKPTGLPMVIKNVRLEGDSAIIRVELMTLLTTYTMRYENEAWKFQPDAEAMAGYAKGKTALVAESKQSGKCSAS